MEVSTTLFLPVLLVGIFGIGMASALAGAGQSLGRDYLAYMAPGATTLAVLTSAVMGGATLLQERLNGVLRQYLVAPVPRSAILAGTVGSAVTKAVLQATGVLVLAGWLGATWRVQPALLAAGVVGLLALAVGFAGLAALVASHASSMAAFHGFISLVNVPLLFVSNALYPLSGQPLWLRAAASVNPVSYAVELLRAGLGAGPQELLGPAGNLAVLVLFGLLGMACGVRGSRRWVRPA